jgi:hypothetical protein
MSTAKKEPAAEQLTKAQKMNARMSEIGEELGKYRIGNHPNLRELVRELDELRAAYPAALEAEGEERTIRERVEAAERKRAIQERQERIDREVEARLAKRPAGRS